MEYNEFGSNGSNTSKLGFGAMRLPMVNIGDHEYVDIDQAVDVMRYAFEKGVNYVDSGFMYCQTESEVAVGRAIKGWREKLTVTTKATKMRMANPGDLRRMLDHQLCKLDLEYVDYYCFHGVGYDNFHDIDKKTGWIDEMTKAKDEGLVKHIGFSFHDEPENMTKLIDLGFFEMVTCQYNYLDQKNAEGMAYAREKGMAVVCMGPVGGGRLAGLPGFLQEANNLDTSNAAQLAVRFVASNPSVNVVLSGMGSRQMVDDNVAAIEAGQLSDAENAELDQLLEKTKELAELYCTGCKYCLPCPQGVDIPARFEAMNCMKVFGMEAHAKQMYGNILQREKKTGKGECIACGQCEPKCPQNIPIIQQLKETAASLGD